MTKKILISMNKNGRKYKPIKKHTNNEQNIIETRQLKNRRKRNKVLVSWYKELKKHYPCVICGESDPRCIDFHHKNPVTKITTVSWLLGQRYSKKRILTEIEKCESICANCHRKITLELY